MSKFLPQSVRILIEELSRLPGIGPKSAQRLAIHLLHSPKSRLQPLGEAILKLRDNVIFCDDCWNIAEENPCLICNNHDRDKRTVCVVEEFLDVVAIERTNEYKGLYHVLHGALSPIDGVGPEELKISALLGRIKKSMDQSHEQGYRIEEVILATNPSLEGEATAMYIQKHLQELSDVKITRIARGLPVGGDLEYADEVTLGRAIKGRSLFG